MTQQDNFCNKIIYCLCTLYFVLCHLTAGATDEHIGYADAFVCKGDTLNYLGMKIFQKGLYSFPLKTLAGEDSTLYLNVDYYPSYNQTFYQTRTQDEVITWRGEQIVFQVGKKYDLRDTLETIEHQCDSIVRIVVNKVQPRTYYIEEYDTVPRDSALIWHDRLVDTSTPGVNDVVDEQFSIYGADSTIVLHLFVENCPVHISTNEFNLVWREGHQKTWYIHHLSQLSPGNYTLTSGTFLRDSYGCDSIDIMHLTVLPRTKALVSDTICQGDTMTYLGVNYTTTGTWTTIIDNHYGGDSVITISLFVAPKYNRSYKQTVSFGTDISWAGEVHEGLLPGEYMFHDTTLSVFSCDSISHLTVTVNKSAQSIAWDFPYDTVSYTSSIPLDAVASSELPVNYTISNDVVAYIVDNTLMFNRVGVITITASQPGDDRFNAAKPLDHKLVIVRATDVDDLKHHTPYTIHKILQDGVLYILRNGNVYDLTGRRLR